jgi:hydrogenase maturation protease
MNPLTPKPPRLLVYGYGNPGRQDDGLGVLLVDRLQSWAAAEELPQASFESNYQLNIEDALRVLETDVVIFADASADEPRAFRFREITAAGTIPFTTHALAPEAVLALCQQLYGRCPRAFLLTLRGLAWEPNEPLTAEAESHLARALEYVKALLLQPGKLGTPLG